jgi:phenylpropionate dioxygenase-like ring-hydroxylating dioxygenase large terminal subunit
MTPTRALPGWYPLLRARALRRQPVTRVLAGTPVRLRREDGDILAAEAASGAARRAREADGWIFVAEGNPPTDACSGPLLIAHPFRHTHIDGSVRACLGDVAENILDTTHTSVVHQGYLRQAGGRRPVEAVLESGDGWVSATYPPDAAPGGWGARLLGAHRFAICDRFRPPAIAEISYTDNDKPVFAARFHLAPITPTETYIAATIAVPGRSPVASLKLAALRLFFQRIFAEDRAILELIGANRVANGGAPLVYTPQDLLRPGIDAILAGRSPLVSASRKALKV